MEKEGECLAGTVETQSGNYKFKNNYFKFHITNFLLEASVSYIYLGYSSGSKNISTPSFGLSRATDFYRTYESMLQFCTADTVLCSDI